MAHECAKETLLRAATLPERANAVRTAIALPGRRLVLHRLVMVAVSRAERAAASLVRS